MNICFHMDNLKIFKSLIKKNPDDLNKYYSEAIKLKSYKILTYIVNELNYIEDYYELKKIIPSGNFDLIKKMGCPIALGCLDIRYRYIEVQNPKSASETPKLDFQAKI